MYQQGEDLISLAFFTYDLHAVHVFSLLPEHLSLKLRAYLPLPPPCDHPAPVTGISAHIASEETRQNCLSRMSDADVPGLPEGDTHCFGGTCL